MFSLCLGSTAWRDGDDGAERCYQSIPHKLSWMDGGQGEMREGPVCLCLPLKRAMFLMDPEINGGREGERRKRPQCNLTAEQT